MVLVKNSTIKTEDNWQYLEEGQDCPSGNIIIDLAYWNENKKELSKHQGKLGLNVAGNEDIETFSSDLSKFELIVITIPVFSDGRGYSLARLIRDSFGFTNEIRANGEILPDQMFYLSRVGFDSFEIADDNLANLAVEKLSEFTVVSQPAADSRISNNQR
jgi:uncharacterized protein (DUF934 family)